jgi:hypothetical protein
VSFGARAEAFARLGRRFDVRVLEPSPPAMPGPLFADDPVAGGEVVPLERAGARSWASICAEEARSGDGDGGLAAWCGDRWLAGWHRLSPLPDSFGDTRASLHALAEHVVAPVRHQANGKIGLRFTRGGFGTPFFVSPASGAHRQVRIEEGDVVACSGDASVRSPVTTLGEAAHFVGLAAPGAPAGVYTPTTPGDAGAGLAVERAAAHVLGEWYGFCASVLEQLRSESGDASLVQLWPEHFDLAVDLGDREAGRRANFGGSPGDEGHPEPYLYVGPWTPRAGEFWNEPFGASLPYQTLLAVERAEDQRALALAFLRRGRDLVAGL